jgi:hypothetical protein
VASSLPTDDALSKAVDTFGYGTYDGQRDDDLHGEDDESREPAGSSLPSEPSEGFDMEFMLSYPQEQAMGPKHASIDWFFSSILPGDGDRPPPGPRPADKTIDDLAAPPSDVRISDTSLPSDSDNPAARSDYYDKMTMGHSKAGPGRLLTFDDIRRFVPPDMMKRDCELDLLRGVEEADRILGAAMADIWPSEDSGSYVTTEKKDISDQSDITPELEETDEPGVAYKEKGGHYVDQDGYVESFPEPERNDSSQEDSLGALGNAWSGYTVEDMSTPSGFPTDNFTEEADYMDENPILPEVWHLQPFGFASTSGTVKMNRQATDIKKVRELTASFLKEHGRKSIVRRSVLSFLQGEGLPQYLASDIIRCMKHDHGILVPDVMDTFPLAKDAPEDLRRLASLHGRLLELSMTTADRRVSSRLNQCAASVARALAKLERGIS